MTAQQVQRVRDLRNLALICKVWNDTVNPELYANLFISPSTATPDTLELLLGSTDGNLNFVSGIHIVRANSLNDCTETLFSAYTGNKVQQAEECFPAEVITMLRILLRRIPKGNLERFTWTMSSFPGQAIIALLLDLHGSSLLELRYNEITHSKPLSAVTGCLRDIHIHNVAVNEPCWAANLLVMNRRTVSNLTIGNEKDLASKYHCAKTYYETIRSEGLLISTINRNKIPVDPEYSTCQLRTLRVIGLNPGRLLNDSKVRITSLASLRVLILESCHNLPALFSALTFPATTESSNQRLRLSALTIRNEVTTNAFRAELLSFLSKLQPLTKLYIMLEGEAQVEELLSVWKVHGMSLRSLIWEERNGQRTSLTKSCAMNTGGIGHLGRIADLCPHLRELGLVINWSTQVRIIRSQQLMVAKAVAKLRNLKTLNFRNMPTVDVERGANAWVAPDAMYAAISHVLLKDLLLYKKEPKLNIFALGALTYCDVWGGNAIAEGSVLDISEALRLRVYHIQYQAKPGVGTVPILTRVATGPPVAIGDLSNNLDIFEPYWLG